MSLILIIILILLLVGGLPVFPHSRNWGYGPSGILGVVLVVLLVLLLLGLFVALLIELSQSISHLAVKGHKAG